MRAIASCTWGASSRVLRQFYISYIRSKIDYGSILYESAAVSNLKRLEVLQYSCIRLMLGVRKTSPILSMQVESNLPSLELHRSYLSVKMLIKLRCKPENCSTVNIMNLNNSNMNMIDYPVNGFISRALKCCEILDICYIKREKTKLYLDRPPWVSLDCVNEEFEESAVCNKDSFRDFLACKYSDYYYCYTDGSKILHGVPSVACAMYFPGKSKISCWKLHPNKSVMFSELLAIKNALIFIKLYTTQNYVVFTDSKSSTSLITSCSPTYIEIVNDIQNILVDVNVNRRVVIQWIKGHSSIPGNDVADRAAKLGHKLKKIC